MKQARLRIVLSAVVVTSLVAAAAHAHVSIASGPGTANVTQEIVFGVGHGCEGNMDTTSVRVDLPPGVVSVRPLHSDFGTVSVEKNGDTFVSVTWTKRTGETLPADTNYYKLVLRARLPDKPFTTLAFPSRQTCAPLDGGAPTVVSWSALPGAVVPDGGIEDEPAPLLVVLPARSPGWNKLTVPADVKELATYFKDAQVVWKGNAAYSANATTTAQIKAEPGVTALTELKAGDEIWVKY